MNLRQAVVFCILMQGNGGILTKAPSYIEEKLKSCEVLLDPETLLDSNNFGVFQKYKKLWQIEDWDGSY